MAMVSSTPLYAPSSAAPVTALPRPYRTANTAETDVKIVQIQVSTMLIPPVKAYYSCENRLLHVKVHKKRRMCTMLFDKGESVLYNNYMLSSISFLG